MAGVWSGSIIYEWINEMNGYGLIQYGPPTDSSVNQGSSVVEGFLIHFRSWDSADVSLDLRDKVHLLPSLLTLPICRISGPH